GPMTLLPAGFGGRVSTRLLTVTLLAVLLPFAIGVWLLLQQEGARIQHDLDLRLNRMSRRYLDDVARSGRELAEACDQAIELLTPMAKAEVPLRPDGQLAVLADVLRRQPTIADVAVESASGETIVAPKGRSARFSVHPIEVGGEVLGTIRVAMQTRQQ